MRPFIRRWWTGFVNTDKTRYSFYTQVQISKMKPFLQGGLLLSNSLKQPTNWFIIIHLR